LLGFPHSFGRDGISAVPRSISHGKDTARGPRW